MPCEGKAERFAGRPVGLRVERVSLRHRDGEALGMDRGLGVAGFALQDRICESPVNKMEMN